MIGAAETKNILQINAKSSSISGAKYAHSPGISNKGMSFGVFGTRYSFPSGSITNIDTKDDLFPEIDLRKPSPKKIDTKHKSSIGFLEPKTDV